MRGMNQATHGNACLVFGAGLHGKVVIDALLSVGFIPRGAIDSDPSRWGTKIFGVPVLGGDEAVKEFIEQGITHFTVGIGSTGDTRLRRKLFEFGLSHDLEPLTVRHRSTIVAPSSILKRGSQLLAGAIVNPDAEIGENVVVNTGAIIEHDCVIQSHAFISPGVRLGGAVRIGEGAHIGIGATVRQGISIGARSVIGAGAVVIEDVPDDVTAVGVPARIQQRRAA